MTAMKRDGMHNGSLIELVLFENAVFHEGKDLLPPFDRGFGKGKHDGHTAGEHIVGYVYDIKEHRLFLSPTLVNEKPRYPCGGYFIDEDAIHSYRIF